MSRFYFHAGTICIVILFITVMPIYCHAQRDEKILDSIHILVEKAPFPLASTTPVQTLSGKKLQQLNHFSVADALRYFSGVQLKDYGGIGGIKTINVRNMGTQHVAVILDGIRIVNAQNGTVDLGKYSLDNVEVIQLFNGGNTEGVQPALNFFASSAIYLQSKKNVFNSSQKHQLKAKIKTGSFGLLNSSLTWHQKINSSTSVSSNIEFITAHGKYHYRYSNGFYDTTAIRNNGDITGVRFENYWFKKKNSSEEFFIKTYFYNSNRGLPGAIVANKYYNPQRLWDKNFFIQSSYKKEISKYYNFLINTKFSFDYTRYVDPDFIMTTGPLNNSYKQKEFYFSAAQEYKIKLWWKWTLATDFLHQTMDADLYRFPFPTRRSFIGALNSSINLKKVKIHAGWVAAYYNERVKFFQATEDKSAIMPSISASWQPFNDIPFSIRSFYKEALRMPSFNDLYYTQIGNIFLKPEYTKQLNIGFTWLPKLKERKFNFSMQADTYYNDVTNKIVAVPAANLFRWMMINLGKVAIHGVDVNMEVSKILSKTFTVNGGINYSWQKALNKTIGQSSYNHQIPYAPHHNGSIIASATWKSWIVNYSFLYTGIRYALPENTSINLLQPWYTSDIGLQKTVSFFKNTCKLSTEINNLFNQYYDVVLNFPMPGRNYSISLSFNF